MQEQWSSISMPAYKMHFHLCYPRPRKIGLELFPQNKWRLDLHKREKKQNLKQKQKKNLQWNKKWMNELNTIIKYNNNYPKLTTKIKMQTKSLALSKMKETLCAIITTNAEWNENLNRIFVLAKNFPTSFFVDQSIIKKSYLFPTNSISEFQNFSISNIQYSNISVLKYFSISVFRTNSISIFQYFSIQVFYLLFSAYNF